MATTIALSGPLSIGVSTFGPITPIAGTTKIQVAIDRTGLVLLTKKFDWALELSTDGGVNYLSWGGAGAMAGSLTDSRSGSVLTESSFTVFIPPADANTRLRGSITTQEIMTTAITIRQS